MFIVLWWAKRPFLSIRTQTLGGTEATLEGGQPDKDPRDAGKLKEAIETHAAVTASLFAGDDSFEAAFDLVG